MQSSKYGNKKAIVDGIRFDSLAEAERYTILLSRLHKGEITDLRLQPRITLMEAWKQLNGETIKSIIYIADFRYVKDGKLYYEDVKGVRTEAYKLKKKLVLDKTGIDIIEVTRKNIDMEPGGAQNG